MSLIPAFEIGLWNAWIFMLGYFLPYILWSFTSRGKAVSKKMKETEMPVKHEKIMAKTFMIIMLGSPIYSVFLPLKLGTTWFYLGLLIFLFAEVMYIGILVTLHTTPPDKPFTTGLYRYTRHPIFIMQLLTFLSISIACLSWIFLLITLIIGILQHIHAPAEERYCLKKYGNNYREYMNKTPRWIGFPKS